jgi:coatomer protein complex subunit gamma
VRILHLIGEEAHNTPSPTKYIRYIYNRIILENATVRAAALSALAKIGLKQNSDKSDNVKVSIRTLIKGYGFFQNNE